MLSTAGGIRALFPDLNLIPGDFSKVFVADGILIEADQFSGTDVRGSENIMLRNGGGERKKLFSAQVNPQSL